MTPNAARIAEIDIQLSQLRAQIENATSERSRVRECLEVLLNVKLELVQIFNNYHNFPAEYGKLHEFVYSSQFDGGVRDDVENCLNRIRGNLETVELHHKEHLETIKNRISSEENRDTTLTITINSLDNQVSNLELERRLLILG